MDRILGLRQGHDVFFSATHRPRQGAEQEELAGGRRRLFAGILTAIRVRGQARVLVRLILPGLPSAPVPRVRVRSCAITLIFVG